MSDRIDPLTEEIASLVYGMVKRWDDYWDAHVRELNADVTSRQALALWQCSEPQPIGELAARMGCDPSSTTGIVDRMEAKGLLRRVPDPADRRTKRVEMTPAGKKLRQQLERRLAAGRPSIIGLSKAEKLQLRDLIVKAMGGL